MPVNIKPLFDKIMDDPDVIPEEGQEKKDLAMSMVLQRATQAVNNEKALGMANSDTSVSKLTDFVTFSKATDYDMVEQAILLMLKKGAPDLLLHLQGMGRQGAKKLDFDSSGKGAKDSGLGTLYRNLMLGYHPDKLPGYGIPRDIMGSEGGHLDDSMKRMGQHFSNVFGEISKTLNGMKKDLIETMREDETLEERLDRFEAESISKKHGIPVDTVRKAQSQRKATSIKVREKVSESGMRGRLGQKKFVVRDKPLQEILDEGYKNVWDFRVKQSAGTSQEVPDILDGTKYPTDFSKLETNLNDMFHENGTMKVQDHLINFQNRSNRLKEIRDTLKETNPDVEFDPNHPELRDESDRSGKPIKLDTGQINRYLKDVDPSGPQWDGPKLKEIPQQELRETPEVERGEKAPPRTAAQVLDEFSNRKAGRATARQEIERRRAEADLKRAAAQTAQDAADKTAAEELTRQADVAQQEANKAKTEWDEKIRRADEEETTKQEAEKTRLAAKKVEADTAEKARLEQEATEAKKVSDEAAKSAAGAGGKKPPGGKVPPVATGGEEESDAQEPPRQAPTKRELKAERDAEKERATQYEAERSAEANKREMAAGQERLNREKVRQADNRFSKLRNANTEDKAAVVQEMVDAGGQEEVHEALRGMHRAEGPANASFHPEIVDALRAKSSQEVQDEVDAMPPARGAKEAENVGTVPDEAPEAPEESAAEEKPTEEELERVEDMDEEDVVEADPADIDEPPVKETVEEATTPASPGAKREEWKEQGRKKGEHPPMNPGDVMTHPKTGQEAVLQDVHRDKEDETDNALFRYTDGSGGFTATSNITDDTKERQWSTFNAQNWEGAVADHKENVEAFGGKPYDGKIYEATKPEEPPAAAVEEPADKEPTPEPEVGEPAPEPEVGEPAPEAKKFKGSNAARKAFMDHFGEDFNDALADGRLDPPEGKDKWAVGDAKAHVETLKPEPTPEKLRMEGLDLVANPASVKDENPAEMKNELTLEDGTKIKFGDPIGDQAVERGGTLRQIYPVELPNGDRLAFYQRSGTGDRDGDGGRAAKGNVDEPEKSDFSVFKGIHSPDGWYIKEGFDHPKGHPLRGLGSELNGQIAAAFNGLRDDGKLPRKLDMKPHSELEINDYLGSEDSIQNNKAVRENPNHRWHDNHERLVKNREADDIPVDPINEAAGMVDSEQAEQLPLFDPDAPPEEPPADPPPAPEEGAEEEPSDEQKVRNLMDKAKDAGVLQHMYEKKYGKDNEFKSFDDFVNEELQAALKKPDISKLQDKFATAFKGHKEAVAKDDAEKASAAEKNEAKKANDTDIVNSLVEDMPEGTTKTDATDKYREILEHKEKYGDVISPAVRKKLAAAADNLVQNHNADYQRAHNLVQQHADAGGFADDATDDHQKKHEDNIAQQREEMETEDSFAEHVSGESGSTARRNAFDNNDSNRVVHVNEDGKVTHSTLMDSRFENGRKKVKEKGESGASAHHNDHKEVHGDDKAVAGKKNTQTHHDWDTAQKGQHGDAGQQQIKAYGDAASKLEEATAADDTDEMEKQKKLMAQMDKESGGKLSTMMSDAEKEEERIKRGQPPGPAPRPGLVWAAGIHHWVNPDKLSELQSGLGDGEGMHITPDDFQSMLGHSDVNPAEPHADGSVGHQGSVHVTTFGAHRVSDVSQGTPANLAQNLGGSAKHGSPADLASHSLGQSLADAGLTGQNPDGSTDHGTSGKVKKGALGAVGDDLHGRDSHGEGTKVERPIASPYVAEVRELANRERDAKRKRQLKTALGRFRAIRDNPLKEAKAGAKAGWKAAGKEVKRGGKKVKTGARKARASTHRGGMRAARAFMGEYAGTGGLESLKMGARDIGREAKAVGRATPLVGSEAPARKRVGELVAHAKKGVKVEQAKAEAAHEARNVRAREQLKTIRTKSAPSAKPTEE